jgi:hypothetical protein
MGGRYAKPDLKEQGGRSFTNLTHSLPFLNTQGTAPALQTIDGCGLMEYPLISKGRAQMRRFGIGILTAILAMPTSWAIADETNLQATDGTTANEVSTDEGTGARQGNASLAPGLMQQALADAERREDMTATSAAPGFDEWKRKVDDATARRGRANTLILSGLGVGLATLVVGEVAASHAMTAMSACAGQQQAALLSANPFSPTFPTVLAQPCSASSSPGLVLAVGGALAIGLGAVGGFHSHDACEDLENLNAEGQAKGYVSLEVTPRGDVQGSYTVTF